MSPCLSKIFLESRQNIGAHRLSLPVPPSWETRPEVPSLVRTSFGRTYVLPSLVPEPSTRWKNRGNRDPPIPRPRRNSFFLSSPNRRRGREKEIPTDGRSLRLLTSHRTPSELVWCLPASEPFPRTREMCRVYVTTVPVCDLHNHQRTHLITGLKFTRRNYVTNTSFGTLETC